MNNIVQNLLSKLKSPKTLMILGVAGILLIFLSTLFSSETDKPVKDGDSQIETEEYRRNLEGEIEQLVSEITGSRKVSVTVTLDSSVRYSYADTKEETSSNKTESDSKTSGSEIKSGYITVKTSSGGEEALLITAQMPEIRGVAVVCEGGDSEILREKIENAVTAALNITSKRVYICGRN